MCPGYVAPFNFTAATVAAFRFPLRLCQKFPTGSPIGDVAMAARSRLTWFLSASSIVACPGASRNSHRIFFAPCAGLESSAR